MPPSPPSAPATIVHIGALDLASYGDQLYPLVAAHELRRRLGDVELLPFGPVGSTGHGSNAGDRSWALGPWTPERAAEIARRATLVLCGGGEFVQGDGGIYAPFYGIDPLDAEMLGMDRWFIEVLGAAESSCPVVWHAPGVPGDLGDDAERVRQAATNRAIVAVRDEQSRDRIVATGVERPVEVVPDSAFLLPRVLPEQLLRSYRDDLRARGHFPDDGPVIAIQGNAVMRDFAKALTRSLGELIPHARVVLVSVSPCHEDGRFADEVADALPSRTWRVPDDAPLEAIAAAVSGADCFLGVSLHGAITAYSYGRPHVTFDPFGQPKLQGFAHLVGAQGWIARDPVDAVEATRARLETGPVHIDPSIAARVDAHFDRVAALCAERVGLAAREPVTWADTAAPLHLSFRRVPRRVDPAPAESVPGLRRPDIEPTTDELRALLTATLDVRARHRAEVADNQGELVRLRAENRDMRGAIDHLEGTCHHLDTTVEQLRAELAASEAARQNAERMIDDARSSRIFRLTGRPAALVRHDAGD